ncbi:MAG: cation:proton antiporter [Pirellulaceae bacterium]|nr:MAG: cation:proton antiporter [Pirellulaceae bacterium]GIW95331.1 MAG: cation:proton antiporter [Pirellulaceae bacterium]
MDNAQAYLVALSTVFLLGIGTQWIAWFLRMPAIVLLLMAGFLVGPVTGWLKPSQLFGDALMPIVSLSVGLILFEGGLNLSFRDLKQIWKPLVGLLTVGVLVTWGGTTLAAYYLLDCSLTTALTLGAILVVTGPTVIIPMLRDIRPRGPVAAIARWEGITIDPLGATLALLVVEAVDAAQHGSFSSATANAFVGLGITALVGTVVGILAGRALVKAMWNFWVPDHLQNPITLLFVIAAFLAGNLLYHESGLLAVTVMGIVLANQESVNVKRILEFKESLTVLLVATLFVLLAANANRTDMMQLGLNGIAFAALLILLVRPVAVLLSTLGTRVTWPEKAFLAWLAPRGIVAAAISSVFAARLGETGTILVPATLVVVLVTVTVYGLTAPWVARRLGLSSLAPQGLLVAGAGPVARALLRPLVERGFPVVVVDTQYEHIRRARDLGISACFANILSEDIEDEIDMSELGRFLGMTSNEEVNALAAARFRERFGPQNVFQLASTEPTRSRWTAKWLEHLAGQRLFSERLTYDYLAEALANGARVKVTVLSETFDYAAYQKHYADQAYPLFIVDGKKLTVLPAGRRIAPRAGQALVSLILPGAEQDTATGAAGSNETSQPAPATTDSSSSSAPTIEA